MFKKIVCLIILGAILLQISACDTGDKKKENYKNLTPIVYEKSENSMKEGANVNLVIPPKDESITGKVLTAFVSMEIEMENYNYYIVDWGDGTWSYNGPYAYNKEHKALGEVRHIYKKAGEYSVKASGLNLAEGTLYGWTKAQTLLVTGEDYEGELIHNVQAISSSNYSNKNKAKAILDGDNNTNWKSEKADSIVSNDYVGLIFDDFYTLNSLEIKTPKDSTIFPSNIAIEYTTDGGASWYVLPHYYYILPNSVNYSIIMNMPNPKGATLSLALDEIVANGIRISSKMYPLSSSGTKTFSISEMRVYGEAEKLFYSSNGGTYDADLNNFWSIFGTAKTEPRMYNSLRGGATNLNPFRSGQTMTASVEWFHWDTAQLLWSGYDDAINILVNAMNDSRYGGDGWRKVGDNYIVDTSEYENNVNNDGYIWVTESSPLHIQMGNHYTTNSSLIIAVRNFLLTGNNTAGFLQSVNGQNQLMLDKVRKSADYMVETLNGKSGLMTIYDPRNSATVDSVSSNYWDSLTFFGYESAYENILFYRAMQCMSDIENYLGNAIYAKRYNSIAEKVRQKFNETFWSEEVGRYITSINVNGEKLDFGITFLNFMAASYGLANETQCQSIYDWVDGKRIVAGDNSTGKDIYNFVVSARSNTVAVESKMVDGKHYWWYNGHEINDVTDGMWGEYGNQMQNGGSIFYTSAYDISGRKNLSNDNAMERFDVIMNEFHKDQLRRDPYTKWSSDAGFLLSIVGEFPESGLVPLTFLNDFIGVNPDVKGLKISANLPSKMDFAGINTYNFGNRKYSIEVNKNIKTPSVKLKNGKYYLRLPANETYYITLENKLVKG